MSAGRGSSSQGPQQIVKGQVALVAGLQAAAACCRSFLGPQPAHKCVVSHPNAVAADSKSVLVDHPVGLLHAMDGEPTATTLLLEALDVQEAAAGSGSTWLVTLAGLLAGRLTGLADDGAMHETYLMAGLSQGVRICQEVAAACAVPLTDLLGPQPCWSRCSAAARPHVLSDKRQHPARVQGSTVAPGAHLDGVSQQLCPAQVQGGRATQGAWLGAQREGGEGVEEGVVGPQSPGEALELAKQQLWLGDKRKEKEEEDEFAWFFNEDAPSVMGREGDWDLEGGREVGEGGKEGRDGGGTSGRSTSEPGLCLAADLEEDQALGDRHHHHQDHYHQDQRHHHHHHDHHDHQRQQQHQQQHVQGGLQPTQQALHASQPSSCPPPAALQFSPCSVLECAAQALAHGREDEMRLATAALTLLIAQPGVPTPALVPPTHPPCTAGSSSSCGSGSSRLAPNSFPAVPTAGAAASQASATGPGQGSVAAAGAGAPPALHVRSRASASLQQPATSSLGHRPGPPPCPPAHTPLSLTAAQLAPSLFPSTGSIQYPLRGPLTPSNFTPHHHHKQLQQQDPQHQHAWLQQQQQQLCSARCANIRCPTHVHVLPLLGPPSCCSRVLPGVCVPLEGLSGVGTADTVARALERTAPGAGVGVGWGRAVPEEGCGTAALEGCGTAALEGGGHSMCTQVDGRGADECAARGKHEALEGAGGATQLRVLFLEGGLGVLQVPAPLPQSSRQQPPAQAQPLTQQQQQQQPQAQQRQARTSTGMRKGFLAGPRAAGPPPLQPPALQPAAAAHRAPALLKHLGPCQLQQPLQGRADASVGGVQPLALQGCESSSATPAQQQPWQACIDASAAQAQLLQPLQGNTDTSAAQAQPSRPLQGCVDTSAVTTPGPSVPAAVVVGHAQQLAGLGEGQRLEQAAAAVRAALAPLQVDLVLAGSHVDPKLAALLLECPPALCSHDGGHACFNHARLDHNLGNPSSNSCSRAGCATSSHDTCHVHRAGSAGRTAHVSGDRPVVLLGSIPQKLLRAAAASCGALPAPDLAAAAAAAAAASADAAPAGPGFAGAAPLSSAAPRAAAGAKAAAQASGAAGARGGAAAAAAAAASAHAPEVGAPGGSCPCRPACVAHGVHVWLLREGGHLLDERGGCSSLGGRTARREDALPAAHPPATPLLVLEPAPTSMPQLPAAPPPAQTWAPSTHELRPVSILLHAPTCAALSSSATAVSSCLARLRSALAAGRVLPGGGVFELLCAARLRAAAAQEEGAAAAEGVGAEACGALQAVASEVGGTSMHGAPKPGLEAGANSGAPVQRVMAAAAAAATSPAVAPQGAAPGCSITKAAAAPAAVGTGTGRAQESTVAAPLKCTGRVPRWQRLNSMLAQDAGSARAAALDSFAGCMEDMVAVLLQNQGNKYEEALERMSSAKALLLQHPQASSPDQPVAHPRARTVLPHQQHPDAYTLAQTVLSELHGDGRAQGPHDITSGHGACLNACPQDEQWWPWASNRQPACTQTVVQHACSLNQGGSDRAQHLPAGAAPVRLTNATHSGSLICVSAAGAVDAPLHETRDADSRHLVEPRDLPRVGDDLCARQVALGAVESLLRLVLLPDTRFINYTC